MKYITFYTQDLFDVWNAEMSALKGYPSGPTQRYTSATEGTDGLFYAAIFEQDIPMLGDMESAHGPIVEQETKDAAMPIQEEFDV
jgi:hypothetical protein